MSIPALVRRLLRHSRGATAVEYGLICALIVLVMLVSLRLVADQTLSMWSNVSTRVLTASDQ